MASAAAPAVHSGPIRFTDDGNALEVAWIAGVLGLDASAVASAEVRPFGANSGNSGEMRRILVTMADGSAPVKLVLKTTRPGGEASSKALGLYREALFFQEFAPELARSVRLPATPLSHADPETGAKAIIMEDLGGCTDVGLLFGTFTPLNHGRDTEAAEKAMGGVGAERATAAMAVTVAAIHAAHWGDASLSERPWLRGSAWAKGEGREAWEMSQGAAKAMWEGVRAKIDAGEQPWWDDRVVALLDSSFSKISWEAQVSRLAAGPLSLVHGDCHPGNFMMCPPAEGDEPPAAVAPGDADAFAARARADAKRLIALDMEQVGVGPGPQDVAQFLISHAGPDVRRGFEDRIIELYHAELGRHGVDTEAFTLEACRAEYVAGGVERWMWLLAYVAGTCPEALTRFLHDQVLAFAVDHGVTAETVGQPRS